MVEYKLETLVELYNSLGEQLDRLQNDALELKSCSVNPSDKRARKEIEKYSKYIHKRIETLTGIRDMLETIFEKAISVEVAELKEN